MLELSTWSGVWTAVLLVLAGGLVVGKLTERPRIPDVVAYLLLGIVLGPAVLGWIHAPASSQLYQWIATFGATLILFDGGRSIQLSTVRPVVWSITALATVGVLVTAMVVASVLHFGFGITWNVSLLAGAVIASTDPATLIPVFKRVPIRPRLQQTVECESAFNDATAAVLTGTLVTAVSHPGYVPITAALREFVHAAGLGLLVGLAVGLLVLWLVSPSGWGVFGEYTSIVLLVAAMAAYQGAETLHASGYMGAFAAGIVTGNGRVFGWPLTAQEEANAHHFGNAVTLVFRILIFALLGTQVDFGDVAHFLRPALGGALALIVVARPLAVVVSVLWDRSARWLWREVLFMCWVRETGVIPAALAAMLSADGVPGSDFIQALTFLAILITLMVQASTTGPVARWLGVATPAVQEPV